MARTSSRKKRPALTRERVLAAAVAFADEHGLAALSMRKLGQALGVEAMSLYNHVANKDDLLDAILEIVIGEIELPAEDEGWKAGMRRRAHSARDMFIRHPWANRLMETRPNPGPASMRYYDAVIGCLRRSGFSIAMAAHAFSVIDSYVYGFSMQEQGMPFDTPEALADVAEAILRQVPRDRYPYFTEMIVDHALKPGYSYAKEFAYGLELILEGLERATAG